MLVIEPAGLEPAGPAPIASRQRQANRRPLLPKITAGTLPRSASAIFSALIQSAAMVGPKADYNGASRINPVSLRKCPDCGQDVSSAALACPHCGRPNRSRSSPIELSGILIIAVVCAGALIWRLSSQNEAPGDAARALPAETTIAQPTRAGAALTATVGYNRKLLLFRVQNADPYAWTACQLSINVQGVSSGYTREIETIRPGITEAALLPSAEFVDGDGRRFDPATQQLSTLDITCETPQGRRAWGGRFQADR